MVMIMTIATTAIIALITPLTIAPVLLPPLSLDDGDVVTAVGPVGVIVVVVVAITIAFDEDEDNSIDSTINVYTQFLNQDM